ncbi:DNA-binding response regulator [Bifidobacterium sp. DSM 109958]|uniref:DNA-binding response regulator n=1 Tax=Bifidobacterium moraviense TaxID=2675323 RepID=A0A7Y0HY73_9BIFI|nr:response regulator transcription factor [Bifidobacterium sp. DSM 109958]NMN00996.1 DNA-binding response regulator [Bifidobacterium sp. DSM 109958]
MNATNPRHDADRAGRTYRIGVVDNDAMTLMALRGLLESRLEPHGIAVAWAVRSGDEAVERCVDAAPRERPDLVLADMGMDDVDGAAVCRRIRAFSDRIVLLGMTSYSLNRYRGMARAAGAQALLDKADFAAMADVLRAWASGRPHVESGFMTPGEAHRALCGSGGRHVGEGDAVPGGEGLTAKEIEVMDRCIQGYTAREVAQQLGLTESTVKTHIRHAIAKLGVRNKLQAVQRWTALRGARPADGAGPTDGAGPAGIAGDRS